MHNAASLLGYNHDGQRNDDTTNGYRHIPTPSVGDTQRAALRTSCRRYVVVVVLKRFGEAESIIVVFMPIRCRDKQYKMH